MPEWQTLHTHINRDMAEHKSPGIPLPFYQIMRKFHVQYSVYLCIMKILQNMQPVCSNQNSYRVKIIGIFSNFEGFIDKSLYWFFQKFFWFIYSFFLFCLDRLYQLFGKPKNIDATNFTLHLNKKKKRNHYQMITPLGLSLFLPRP